jgi:hypothetical protein
MILPDARRNIFRLNVPFNWKAREIKSVLKINNMTVDWGLIRRNEAMRHKIITAANRTVNRPFNNFI